MTATATPTRERVFILAASKDQAAIFARHWAAEGPERRLQDAIYLHNRPSLEGYMVTKQDRVVAVDGHWLHPNSRHMESLLRRTLAKTGLALDIIEPVELPS